MIHGIFHLVQDYEMKGINTLGQALDPGGVASFSAPQWTAGYLTLRSRHSLGTGTILMVALLLLRWGIRNKEWK